MWVPQSSLTEFTGTQCYEAYPKNAQTTICDQSTQNVSTSNTYRYTYRLRGLSKQWSQHSVCNQSRHNLVNPKSADGIRWYHFATRPLKKKCDSTHFVPVTRAHNTPERRACKHLFCTATGHQSTRSEGCLQPKYTGKALHYIPKSAAEQSCAAYSVLRPRHSLSTAHIATENNTHICTA